MANDGQIVFEVTADGKKAKASIRDITKDIENESKKWDKAAKESTDNIGNGFSSMLKKIGGAIVAAKIGQKLLQIGKDAIQLASDLEEVQNVVDTTFGSGARDIEAWAKTAGTQFGLTELQAKQFASTMGAMMKSSGLAGEEIVDMSKDLAGLAADMASFYNLDFDTAFQKIRSGISGETEPLKQLGINMSVANLNAYALQKGLAKTFEQMTQGEQTMLRYQYLMEATSDAQGDFAKTAEGYANSARTLETNINQIKSTLGTLIEGPLNTLLNKVNELLSPGEKQRTVFDDINDIQVETEEKVAKIKAIADKAEELRVVLETIGGSDADTVITNIASGANVLDSKSPSTWRALAGALKNVDGLQNIFGGSNAKQNIEDLATALSSTELDSTKADAWKTFLGALSDNADAVSKLTGKSAEETAKWLKELAGAADDLSPDDAQAWDTLLSTLVAGISVDTPEGKQFIENLSTQFLAMGKDSEDAVKGLSSLGFSTDQITEKQETWLKTCKDLVKTIPGLADIINTETGEIKGGTGALSDYVKEWQQSQEKIARWKAYYQMREKLDQANNGLYELEMWKNAYRKMFLDEYPNFDLTDYEDEGALADLLSGGGYGAYGKKYAEAFLEWRTAADGAAASTRVLDVIYKELIEDFGEMTEEEANAADSIDGWSDKTKAAARTAVASASEALTAVEEHYKSVRDAVAQTVDSVVKGFEKMSMAGDEYRKKSSELAEEETETLKKYSDEFSKYKNADGTVNLKKMAEDWDSLSNSQKDAYNALAKIHNEQIEVNKALDEYKPENMIAGLESQVKYMQDYLDNLETVKSYGVSAELLAMLSDGSEESAEYLSQLAKGGKDAAHEVDKAFAAVTAKKQEFTDALTNKQLSVDQVYEDLVKKAQEAVAELDLRSEAEQKTNNTLDGIVSAIKANVPDVADAVDQILAEVSRLAGIGVTIGIGGSGIIDFSPDDDTRSNDVVASFASGTNYVPYDMFARIHEGEAVLTAEENKVWQMFKNGGIAGFSLEELGGVMRDNVKPGGNVYLDGKAVGSVISAQQGKSYRQLQRSGWQV